MSESNAQIARDNHFVPIFYLNRWRGDDGKVEVVRKIRGKIVRSRRSPKNTGFTVDLYSYDEKFVEASPDEIETQILRPLDNSGAIIVSKIISREELSDSEKEIWARFIVSMRMRSPTMIAKAEERASERISRMLDDMEADYHAHKSPNDPETPLGWMNANKPGLLESFGKRRLGQLINGSELAAGLLAFKWMAIDLSKSSVPLLTSDHPCVYTKGLGDPLCLIALPLSPRHAFIAYRDQRLADKILSTKPSEVAKKFNGSVVAQCIARVYAASPTPDSFFQKRLRASEFDGEAA